MRTDIPRYHASVAIRTSSRRQEAERLSCFLLAALHGHPAKPPLASQSIPKKIPPKVCLATSGSRRMEARIAMAAPATTSKDHVKLVFRDPASFSFERWRCIKFGSFGSRILYTATAPTTLPETLLRSMAGLGERACRRSFNNSKTNRLGWQSIRR